MTRSILRYQVGDDQDGIAFDGAGVVTYTLSFSEAVQSVTEGDLTVTGAEGYTVSHEAGSDTASVTVTVADGSIENVSVSVNSSIVDIAGNPLIEVVDGDQTVDTVNPSTWALLWSVTWLIFSDSDDGSTMTVSFSFDEAMDQGVAPTVTFDPAVASTLTGQTGRWTDAQTYVVEAVVADAGFDADEVTIDITGAQDVAGNIQEDHSATVGLEIDTQTTSSSITIEVADSDQTDGDAATSFTVSTSDLDPGMLHVEMRGSEFTALTSIKSDYLNDVSAKIGGLQTAASDAQGFEDALTAAEGDRDEYLAAEGFAGAMPWS